MSSPPRTEPPAGAAAQSATPTALGGRETPAESLRIGDLARLVGTTPRTIRYYEEIGLLPEPR